MSETLEPCRLCPPLRSRGGGSKAAGGVVRCGFLMHDPSRVAATPLLPLNQHLAGLGRYFAGGDF
jgi:hypothetical protein